jgi:hypothetical protein
MSVRVNCGLVRLSLMWEGRVALITRLQFFKEQP